MTNQIINQIQIGDTIYDIEVKVKEKPGQFIDSTGAIYDSSMELTNSNYGVIIDPAKRLAAYIISFSNGSIPNDNYVSLNKIKELGIGKAEQLYDKTLQKDLKNFDSYFPALTPYASLVSSGDIGEGSYYWPKGYIPCVEDIFELECIPNVKESLIKLITVHGTTYPLILAATEETTYSTNAFYLSSALEIGKDNSRGLSSNSDYIVFKRY